MATGMDDFGIFFSDSLGGSGQSEGDATMIKRRFREFLREFRGNLFHKYPTKNDMFLSTFLGHSGDYVYRNQLEIAVTTRSNFITVIRENITSR